ncbi:hypothetical protein [Nocardioides sp. Leaf285]|uniref:hypothetical protein n=1 Tax=Nocardioides sp. Leaf285 TaxID=1736322 RepID=UPI00072A5CBF|nr:hypothetical protein [Nocardioides sp. Leaf285]KQP63026.1 hypothetical protein ASF47_18615 [Nocardioides sp. Leaf285]
MSAPASPMHRTTNGVTVRATAREARTLSALVSPTRSFVATPVRGEYFMPAPSASLAVRDAAFLAENGVEVVAVHEAAPQTHPETPR